MELEFARLQKLNELQAAIGYKFKDTELLNTALTHTSYVKGDGNGSVHNERLEFLGDAVLELCVSEKLYREYPELNEGVMTRVRSLSVCEGALHKSAGVIICCLAMARSTRAAGASRLYWRTRWRR